MKRLVMLICVFVLMFDLADDGCLGKAMFVAPHSPVKSLEVSSDHYGSEAPHCHHEILRANCQPLFSTPRGQPTNPVVKQSRKIIVTSHLSGAGGLPG
jgi:hypothetical protein